MGNTVSYIITKEQWDDLCEQVRELKEILTGDKEPETKKWLNSKEASEMLGVNRQTFQRWINKGVFPFTPTQYLGKIYYKRSDLEAFLESHIKEQEGK